MSDRIVRFSETSWQEVEALPEPLRWTVQRVGYTVTPHHGLEVIAIQLVRPDT